MVLGGGESTASLEWRHCLSALVESLIGTSAGATVAAQVSSGLSLHELYSRQTDPALQVDELTPDATLVEALQKFLSAEAKTADMVEIHRRVGDFALHAPTVTEPARRSVIARGYQVTLGPIEYCGWSR